MILAPEISGQSLDKFISFTEEQQTPQSNPAQVTCIGNAPDKILSEKALRAFSGDKFPA
jgi:hypothetical protein